MTKPILELRNVTKQYNPDEPKAVDNLNLRLNDDEILTLVGPSGCGKTTVLRLIAGFENPDSGEIKLNGRNISSPGSFVPPEKRAIGMVFQDLALFPHMTVMENIAFGLKKSTDNREEKLDNIMKLVGLNAHRIRYPEQLSGGQRQRVALARALVVEPDLILMDEPFSSLDRDLRVRMRREIRTIVKESNTPTIFVTHDQEEALFLGDRMAVMCRGKIEQSGDPLQVVIEPRTRFVARFLGPTDFLPAHKKETSIETELGRLPKSMVKTPGCENFELMLRADDVVIQPAENKNSDGVVEESDFLGGMFRYRVRLNSGRRIHSLLHHSEKLSPGTAVKVQIAPGHQLVGFTGSCRTD